MNGPIKHILVYLDGTEESLTAAQYAICLSKATGALLSAMYIVNTRALNDLVKSHIFIESEQDEYQRDLQEDARKYLRLMEKMAQEKSVAVSVYEESGAVQGVIRDFIRNNDVDLLVSGKVSNIRSRRDELNNDTERVIRNVSCSVLVVKDEERVWEMFDQMA
ncbi:MAG: universal stress protein UspA [Spirochaetaceae bacterium 4572_59]|nr:MAG: universal stress protein UspA [Spirochaetaceae bacterium 4572_59]